ncbi:PilN domain-containing protein [Rhodoligotrophos defluvii]|uniref:PilN domain-containing protein n=1 Tax=Rhodoligotrophos defluvii TaxID=2561934 RepID=UPI0010C99531|nr:PilN domain-containing protein [Rhodoligotrophos defluvii]
MKTILACATGFFSWWFRELAGLVPQPIRYRLSPERQPLLLALKGGQLEIRLPGKPEANFAIEGIEHPDGTAGLRTFIASRRLRHRRAIVELPPGHVLTPVVDLPIEAAMNLDEVLGHEIERHTPFTRNQVAYDKRVIGTDPDGKRLKVQLWIAPLAEVTRSLDWLAQAGLSLIRVAAAGDGQANSPYNLLPPHLRPKSESRLAVPIAALVLLVVALSAALAYVTLEQKTAMAARIEAQAAELRKQRIAQAERQAKIEQFEQLLNLAVATRARAIPTIELLRDLTQHTPDDTWLVQLTMTNDNVLVAGFTRDANALMRSLQQAPVFSNIRYSAPVTRDPSSAYDRFNLMFKLNPGAAQ